MHKINEFMLVSGTSSLSIAPSTGKLTRLMHENKNLFVEPLAHEREQALSDENRLLFQSLDAWGGDECFPTVGGSKLWELRDHGVVWGKAPSLNFAHDNQCTSGWQWNSTHFKRTIKSLRENIKAPRLGAYSIHINFSELFPLNTFHPEIHSEIHAKSIYASHALFAAEPGDFVEWGFIPLHSTVDSVLAGEFSRQVLAARKFAEVAAPVASKFYIQTPPGQLFFTSLVRKELGLRIDVVQSDTLPWVGIWWCHNGWGDGRPHSTVGIEPTNIPSDGPILNLESNKLSASVSGQIAWIISKV